MSKVVKDSDPGFKKLKSRMGKLAKSITVGIHADRASASHGGTTMLKVALAHEFGAPSRGLPERSFVRSWVDEGGDEIYKVLEILDRKVISGKLSVDLARQQAAHAFAGQMQRRIRDNKIRPDISDKTKAAKGSSTVLVDTAQLLQSIEGRAAK